MKRIMFIEGEDEELVLRLCDKIQSIVDNAVEKSQDFDLELTYFIEQ